MTTPQAGPFEDGPGHLVAVLDMTVEVTDTSGRHTSGRLAGTGNRLRLEVADPAVVAAATGRGATHGLCATLARAGVRAELHGPHGRVALVEPGRTSRVGALLAGSPHVILERAGWALLARAVVRPGVAVAVGSAVALVVGGTLLRGRRVHRR